MKKRILALVAVLAVVGLLLPATVFAAVEDTVECTVTATLVAVTVEDGSVAYGTLALGTTKNTALYDDPDNLNGMATAQTQTITNTGTVAEDFSIRTEDALGTIHWMLHATTPSTDQFTHAYNVADAAYTGSGTITFTKWAASNVGENVATDVAVDGVKYLELEISMPTSVTDAGTHTITVTVLATQHGT